MSQRNFSAFLKNKMYNLCFYFQNLFLMMDERRVAEYFVVAGLPSNPVPLAEFSCDGANLKSTHSLAPVTDIGVVNRSLGEVVPDGKILILLLNINKVKK